MMKRQMEANKRNNWVKERILNTIMSLNAEFSHITYYL